MIFSKRKMKQNFDFKLQGKYIEVVKPFQLTGNNKITELPTIFQRASQNS
jgi:hypothetical protein